MVNGPMKHLNASLMQLARLALIILCLPSVGFSQRPQVDVGWRVEVQFLGETKVGEITAIARTGWPTIRFYDGHRVRESVFSPRHVVRVLGENPGAKSRFWTDQSGKFRMRANLVSLDQTSATFRKTDGTEVTVPRAKLSDADQAHLSEIEPLVWPPGRPPGTPDDYQGTLGLAGGAVAEQIRRQSEDIRHRSEEIQRQAEAIRGQHGEARLAASRRMPSEPSVSLSDAKEAFATAKPLPMQAAGNSVYTPDPLPVSAAPLNLPTFAHEGAGGNPELVLSPQRTAFVIVTNPFSSAKQTIAVGTAEQTTTLEIGEGQSVLAVSDDASHLWMGSAPKGFAAHRIERWLVSDAGLQLDPSSPLIPLADQPIRLYQMPNQRALIHSRDHFSVWDVEAAKTLYRYAAIATPAASGRGRYLAILGRDEKIRIFDTDSISTVKVLKTDVAKPAAVSFSPSGTSLAVTNGSRTQVVDIASGEPRSDYFPVTKTVAHESPVWLSERFLLLGQSEVADLETGRAIWSVPYDRHRSTQAKAIGNGQLFYAWKSDKQAAAETLLFEPSQLAKMAAGKSGEYREIPPGATASVDVSQLHVHAAQVKREWEQRLRAAGYTLADKGQLQVSIVSKVGETKEIRVVDSLAEAGLKNAGTPASYRPSEIHIRIAFGDEVMTTRTLRYDLPRSSRSLHTRKGETPQAALSRMTTPEPSDMTRLQIPQAGSASPLSSDTSVQKGRLDWLPDALQRQR